MKKVFSSLFQLDSYTQVFLPPSDRYINCIHILVYTVIAACGSDGLTQIYLVSSFCLSLSSSSFFSSSCKFVHLLLHLSNQAETRRSFLNKQKTAETAEGTSLPPIQQLLHIPFNMEYVRTDRCTVCFFGFHQFCYIYPE